jgi:hypothetical protein
MDTNEQLFSSSVSWEMAIVASPAVVCAEDPVQRGAGCWSHAQSPKSNLSPKSSDLGT